MDRPVVAIIIATYLALTVVTAYSTDMDAVVADLPTMIEANVNAEVGSGLPYTLVCYLYEDDEKESEYDPNEIFYFGADEDRIRAEIEKKMKYRNPAEKAHHDIRLIIGSSFITTAVVMVVLGIVHTKKEIPRDYFKNKRKYDELYDKLGYIPLTEVKDVYYPSIVIGTALGSSGVYLFL
jgi:hypothetical protein